MRLTAALLLLATALVQPLRADPKLVLFGNFPEDDERRAAVEAGQEAVDASNAQQLGPRLKLALVNTGPGEAAAEAAARRVAADPDVLAVIVHGEDGVAPGALAAFGQARLAVVSASSWARPRPSEAGTTWLCPGLEDLAGTAALYARREAKAASVGVIDDGAATSTAAARAFAARYRALGGKVPFEATWTGDAVGLSATVKGLAAHWPQLVFYTGSGETAGRLVLAMKGEKALKNADLIGLPPLFDPAFFNTTRLKGMRTRALFPCPDYDGISALVRDIGFAFPRTSPEYRAYVHFANRHPGRWISMLFDGVALAARAVRTASQAASGPAPVATAGAAEATGATPTAASAAMASAASSAAAAGPGTAAAAGVSPGASAPAAVTVLAGARTPEAPSPDPTAVPALAEPAAPAAGAPLPGLTREQVRLGLLGLEGYRGIRGAVKFSASREPVEPRAMVYFALNHVSRKDMYWKQKAYGPPF